MARCLVAAEKLWCYFIKSTVSAESGRYKWKLMSYVNEVNEKLSGPCHRCTLDGLALFIFHCWQVSCLRVTGQVNEWDIILFFRLPIKRKKNLTLYFFAWNRGKMFPFSVDRHGNSPIGCDSFPLALLYFGGDSSWFCRYVIRPTLCAVNVTWSDNWLLTESLPSNLWKLTIFLKIVKHIPVVK